MWWKLFKKNKKNKRQEERYNSVKRRQVVFDKRFGPTSKWHNRIKSHSNQAFPSLRLSEVFDLVKEGRQFLDDYKHRSDLPKSLLFYASLSGYEHNQQEEKMLKRSIHAQLTSLLCSNLPHIINHCCECVDCFMQLYNRMIAHVLAFTGTCGLEWRSRSFTLISKCKSCLSSCQV